MIKLFKALSDETRLRILSLILEGEMCVCEIEKSLNLTQSNASRHLAVLRNAGILVYSKKAQWAYYKINEDFCKNHKELYEYLNKSLKLLTSYHDDRIQMLLCKQEIMCN